MFYEVNYFLKPTKIKTRVIEIIFNLYFAIIRAKFICAVILIQTPQLYKNNKITKTGIFGEKLTSIF